MRRSEHLRRWLHWTLSQGCCRMEVRAKGREGAKGRQGKVSGVKQGGGDENTGRTQQLNLYLGICLCLCLINSSPLHTLPCLGFTARRQPSPAYPLFHPPPPTHLPRPVPTLHLTIFTHPPQSSSPPSPPSPPSLVLCPSTLCFLWCQVLQRVRYLLKVELPPVPVSSTSFLRHLLPTLPSPSPPAFSCQVLQRVRYLCEVERPLVPVCTSSTPPPSFSTSFPLCTFPPPPLHPLPGVAAGALSVGG